MATGSREGSTIRVGANIYSIPDVSSNGDFILSVGNQTISGTKTFLNNIIADISGNTDTATTLQTARTLWGQSFNGSTDVSGNLTSVGNITGSGAITVTAGGTNQNITLTPTGTGVVNASTSLSEGGTALTTKYVQTGAVNQTIGGTKTFSSTITGSVSGNAGTATTLQTARTIAMSGGATGTATSFNGSANITIPVTGLNASNLDSGTVPDARLSGTYTGVNISGNAGTATTLQTTRTLWGQNFNGSANVTGNLTSVGNITGTGAITVTAGGTNQSITLTPSGTGTVNAPTFNATSTTNGGFQGVDADTAALPSFTWSADLNTGMYHPAADTIGLTTSGTERLRVGSTGNVGINNTILESRLNINENILHDNLFNYSTAQLTIFDPSNNGGSVPNGTRDSLYLVREGVSGQAYGNKVAFAIGRYENVSLNSRTQLDIKLNDGAFTTDYNVLSLRSNGQVDIGTGTVKPLIIVNSVDAGGVAAPTFTTRSNGTKLVLYPNVSSTTTDYGIGIESSNMWFSVPDNNSPRGFKWYGGITEVARLDGTGNLSVNGAITEGGTALTTKYVQTGAVNQTIGGTKTFSSTITGSVSGNAGTATTLQTARTIAISGGATGTATSFNGSANITIPVTGLNADNLNAGTVPDARLSGTYTGVNISGNAGTATTLQTARTIAMSGGATGTATSFNGSANITIPVTALNADNLNAGTVPDARLSGTYTGFSHKLNGNTTVFTEPNTGSSSDLGRTVYGLAEYRSNSGTQTGAIVFIQSTTASSIMYQLEIAGFQYSAARITKITVQGYRTTGAWSATDKISTGEQDVDARWAVDPTGKNCLILGDIGTVWSFPHFSIVRAMFSHNGTTDAICTGWTVAIVTDLTGYTNVTAVLANSSLSTSITGNAGTATTATTLATTRTLWGQNFNGSANVSGNLTSVGNITGTGAITVTAGGTDQNITLTPSGTGTVNAPTFNATSTTNGGFQGVAADTAALPSFTWSGDLNTGMYRPTGDTIGFTTGGTERLRIENTVISSSQAQLQITRGNGTANGGGQIYLNGATGNRIDFNVQGVAPPSFTTRSAGTKIVLYPNISATTTDYALGIESGTFWQSIPNTTNTLFKWYAGTTRIAQLSNSGFFVDSIQSASASNALFYNSSTGEISYQPTSSTPGVLTSVIQSAKISYTDAANSNAARFIVANGQAVTLTASQKVQLQFVMQFASTASGHNVGATIGRGTTSGVSTSYINLANNVAFSTTDLTITNTIATIDNLNTGLSQQWYQNANETATINMNVLDQPGAGTFYYAVRVNCVLSSRFYIRNSYFIITIINT